MGRQGLVVLGVGVLLLVGCGDDLVVVEQDVVVGDAAGGDDIEPDVADGDAVLVNDLVIEDGAGGMDSSVGDVADSTVDTTVSGDVGTYDAPSDLVDAVVPTPPDSPYACVMDPDCHWVMVASHRGYHLVLPENSLAALRAAAGAGADFVEIDVRETADEKLVLMHDSDVDRTTDGTGDVNTFTYEQLHELSLDYAGPEDEYDPDIHQIPTFEEALALARELGVALYVDQKTGRTDLVLSAIRSGPYFDIAMVRDDIDSVAAMAQEESQLWVMPAIEDEADFERVLELIPNVRIVEISQGGANAELTATIAQAGVKAQQDMLGPVDLVGMMGDYTAWKAFIDIGLFLPQTDYPQILAPAVRTFNETGVFPESGPAYEAE